MLRRRMLVRWSIQQFLDYYGPTQWGTPVFRILLSTVGHLTTYSTVLPTNQRLLCVNCTCAIFTLFIKFCVYINISFKQILTFSKFHHKSWKENSVKIFLHTCVSIWCPCFMIETKNSSRSHIFSFFRLKRNNFISLWETKTRYFYAHWCGIYRL